MSRNKLKFIYLFVSNQMELKQLNKAILITFNTIFP